MKAYRQLESRFARALLLRSVEDLLHWDTASMMPVAAAPVRGEQVALLRVLRHDIVAAAEIPALLADAEAEAATLDAWQRANLREMRWMWIHDAAVPRDLVAALSRACSACEARWRSARASSDFAAVAPLLEEVLRLVRQSAQARADVLGVRPYEALVDEHEPGVRCSDLDRLFDALAQRLPSLIDRVIEAQARGPQVLPLEGPFPTDVQHRVAKRLMGVLGFDDAHGRLDVSAHPFCGGNPDDVRITTRYDETDFASSLMGVLHETGHALYQRGLPAAWRHQPVGEPRGMGVHESQSLLIEMQACRSRAFIGYLAPLLAEAFGGEGPAWSADNLYARNVRVKRDFIRVDADEVTYPAHVIVRYRLEKAMVEGELEVADLPAAWNEGMGELLAIAPPDDRRGCLQDIHWFDGVFGYFPSYTLGAVLAAQLFRAANEQIPGIGEGLKRGDFSPLLGWLREHVHGVGSLYDTPELIRRATGEPLDERHYLAHIEQRYL